MRPVVVGQDRTFGRCIKKVCVRQSAPFFARYCRLKRLLTISILPVPKAQFKAMTRITG
jgi:hypothetical protein